MLPALVLFLAIAGNSDAACYCICNDGLSEGIYQNNIDYAFGAGADCTPIMQNGPCFQPNTVKDHCNFSVNSYYQRNGQKQGTCSFLNTTTVVQEPPPAISECVYPSSPRAVEKPIINFSLSIKITGVLKARFPILKLITNYPLTRQRQIPTACCAVNNFIRQEHALDRLFAEYSEENMIFHDIPESSQDQEAIHFDASQTAQMGQVRDQIATQMWNDYTRRRT